jgi:pimeloyl-ACP methyl ester carboxylesterase
MTHARTLTGRLPNGAGWIIEVPEAWNGTLCLFSHGYGELGPDTPPDAAGDPVTREALLRSGYALVASTYATQGWAVADSLIDQVAAVDEFRARIGTPDTVIAWGRSMGGLITAALAQVAPEAIDAAVPMCASVAGPIPMLNQGLDGAFVLTTLLYPDREVELVGVSEDDRSRLGRGADLVGEALATPAGRARFAFAAAVAQMPTWTVANLDRVRADGPEPTADDRDGQLANQAKVFHYAAFSPRLDLEARAGGVFSWNDGIDYAFQLRRSGFDDLVQWAYAEAGLTIDDDLQRLADAPRVTADPDAVAYMERNLTPDGGIGVPVLTLSLTGDFAPTVTQTAAYHDVVADAGNSALLRQTFVHGPGHCAFSTAEIVAAIAAADERVRSGAWPRLDASALNERASRIASARWPRLKPPRFVDYTPHPHVRPYPRTDRAIPLSTPTRSIP